MQMNMTEHFLDVAIDGGEQIEILGRSAFFLEAAAKTDGSMDSFGTAGTCGSFGGTFGSIGSWGCCC